MFAILTPFFEHNINLRSFEAVNLYMNASSTQIFESALSRNSNSPLRRFLFHCRSGMHGELATKFITALSGLQNLVRVWSYEDGSGRRWCASLAQMLEDPTSKLENLNIGHNCMNNEEVVVLANALANK